VRNLLFGVFQQPLQPGPVTFLKTCIPTGARSFGSLRRTREQVLVLQRVPGLALQRPREVRYLPLTSDSVSPKAD